MVVGKNYIAVLIEIVCKIVVSARVFRHAVRNLNHALGIAHVVPKIALQYGAVKTLKFLCLHKNLLLSHVRKSFSIWIYCNTAFLRFQDAKIRNFTRFCYIIWLYDFKNHKKYVLLDGKRP